MKTSRRLAGVAAASLVLLLSGAGPVVAAAAPRASAQALTTSGGYCDDDTGVTVVVDMREFGDDVIVRCVAGPLSSGYTGLDALQDAGFSLTGVSGTGLQFVCRISGRPSADEPLAVEGDPDYRETCQHTPPTSAYWAYSYATNGGDWDYSTVGASSHPVIEGGFEGWTFSLNNSGGAQPVPPISPERPGSTPPTPPPSAPTHDSPPTSHPESSNRDNTPSSEPPPSTEAPTTDPPDPGRPAGASLVKHGDQTTPTPTLTPSPGTTSPTDDAVVTGEVPVSSDDPASGSATSTIVGVGVLAILGLGAGLTVWRRSHRG